MIYYDCKFCGFSGCVDKRTDTQPETKVGNYGFNATPSPTEQESEKYVSTVVSFTAASGTTPAKLSDASFGFGDRGFRGSMALRVSTDSGTNDGDYTIAARGLTRGELLLSDDDSLTTETAATAGEVTISRLTYKPNVTQGCPLCGSLNSR